VGEGGCTASCKREYLLALTVEKDEARKEVPRDLYIKERIITIYRTTTTLIRKSGNK